MWTKGRPAGRDAMEKTGHDLPGFVSGEADLHLETGLPQLAEAAPVDTGVRVLKRCVYFPDSGAEDGVGTGRRLASMATGLQGHIKSGAMRTPSGIIKRHPFRMRSPAELRSATADDFTFANDDATDGRVGPGPSLHRPCKPNGFIHPARVTGTCARPGV